jgi:hypothetical protein
VKDVMGEISAAGMLAAISPVMGLIKQVAAIGAVAILGAVTADRKNVTKAVRNLIGRGDPAKLPTTTGLASEVNAAKPKLARVAKKAGAKKPGRARRKTRHIAQAT